MDLKKLTDQQLDDHRRDVLQELERRENLALIPDQIRELRHKYVEGGGDPKDLV